MRKMYAPKMSVIRFRESDVIVASGTLSPDIFTLSGFDDGTKGNVQYTYMGETYNNSNQTSGYAVMEEYHPGATSWDGPVVAGAGRGLSWAFSHDDSGTGWNYPDGTYRYNSSDNLWYWQQ